MLRNLSVSYIHLPYTGYMDAERKSCETCHGDGEIAEPDEVYDVIVCPSCGGSGKADPEDSLLDSGPEPSSSNPISPADAVRRYWNPEQIPETWQRLS
jgi:hypothetical protein